MKTTKDQREKMRASIESSISFEKPFDGVIEFTCGAADFILCALDDIDTLEAQIKAASSEI
jgi:hypothetical protein